MGRGGGEKMMVRPPSPSMAMGTSRKKTSMMHMTFFWGKDVVVLFAGFPDRRPSIGPYMFALLFIFSLAFVAEMLSFLSRRVSRTSSSGLLPTVVYAVRMGLSYLVMLAIMSFNGGVLLAAVSGHAAGFLLFYGKGKVKGRGKGGSESAEQHC